MSALLSLLLFAAPGALPAKPVAATIDVPVPAGRISSRNMGSVIAVLQKEGYKAKLVRDDDDYNVESATSGASFYIYPQNCEQKVDCEDMLFRAAYTKRDKDPVTVTQINQFNRDSRWVRAYLDKDDDPVVEMDVLFTDQQVDEKMFIEAVDIWTRAMGEFHKTIGF